MFELSVRFMDGSTRSIAAAPEMTMAEIRAEVRAQIEEEHELSAFHDVTLFQDTQELLNGTKVQVELQAVTTKSIDKVLDALLGCVDAEVLPDIVNDAVAVFGEDWELEPMHCERLWDILLSFDSEV